MMMMCPSGFCLRLEIEQFNFRLVRPSSSMRVRKTMNTEHIVDQKLFPHRSGGVADYRAQISTFPQGKAKASNSGSYRQQNVLPQVVYVGCLAFQAFKIFQLIGLIKRSAAPSKLINFDQNRVAVSSPLPDINTQSR